MADRAVAGRMALAIPSAAAGLRSGALGTRSAVALEAPTGVGASERPLSRGMDRPVGKEGHRDASAAGSGGAMADEADAGAGCRTRMSLLKVVVVEVAAMATGVSAVRGAQARSNEQGARDGRGPCDSVLRTESAGWCCWSIVPRRADRCDSRRRWPRGTGRRPLGVLTATRKRDPHRPGGNGNRTLRLACERRPRRSTMGAAGVLFA
ncbi:hypothetical protein CAUPRSCDRAFT_10828 [Caulochytrium protostelioides]|uniref:Uncharacterized protein n=1 Tax=Caulochytrium protostelioides TaxID=1555241 RepID=A0A4V1ITL8_9FUNG|nr:hypothetical protein CAUPRSCDRAFT_10828 [Caulochytrium protostelioides]